MIVVELLARAKDGEGVKSGPIGLAVILVLCIAMYFLMKSMSKHLKRVRDDFPADLGGPRGENMPTPSGDSAQSAITKPSGSVPPAAESP